jgi:hypothetical protein
MTALFFIFLRMPALAQAHPYGQTIYSGVRLRMSGPARLDAQQRDDSEG